MRHTRERMHAQTHIQTHAHAQPRAHACTHTHKKKSHARTMLHTLMRHHDILSSFASPDPRRGSSRPLGTWSVRRKWDWTESLSGYALYNASLKTHVVKEFRPEEKSNLWTDAGVDQNFQIYLGATGPYEFQEKTVWTNPLVPCLQGRSVWGNGAGSSSKVSPEIGIGPRMALPRILTGLYECRRTFR